MHPFTLLGDPVRLRIVELLATGEKPVEIIGQERRIGQPSVSHHLRLLKDAGFVDCRTIGKSNKYRLNWNAMTSLDTAVEELFAAWEDRTGWPYDDFRPAAPRDCIASGAPDFEGVRSARSNRVPAKTTGGSSPIEPAQGRRGFLRDEIDCASYMRRNRCHSERAWLIPPARSEWRCIRADASMKT